jgi:two-component system osmolarity sensor histidine kinase EnvZ
MKIFLPNFLKRFFKYIKGFMPKTLFFRTMLILFIPITIIQIVSVVVFFDNHWSKVSKRLSRSLAGDIINISETIEQFPKSKNFIIENAEKNLGIKYELLKNTNLLTNDKNKKLINVEELITQQLTEALNKKYEAKNINVLLDQENKKIIISVAKDKNIEVFTTHEKRIYSSSTIAFVMWLAGSSFLLFLIAVLFLRIQVRSVKKLEEAAIHFGKGADVPNFKPSGSSEVRNAANAFITMRNRIKKQITERTQMLAGVSHDLRTPLTRMKLQLALMEQNEDQIELTKDIAEMEKMIDGYLSFAKGEGSEKIEELNIIDLSKNIINKTKKNHEKIEFRTDCQTEFAKVRPQSFERCVGNILSNACRYGETIEVLLETDDRELKITIDDDGPGIPADKRDDVFRAFFRIDTSRNLDTGGVGLGMSIAKDIATSHGGNITLDDSPIGGLRVIISIPLN